MRLLRADQLAFAGYRLTGAVGHRLLRTRNAVPSQRPHHAAIGRTSLGDEAYVDVSGLTRTKQPWSSDTLVRLPADGPWITTLTARTSIAARAVGSSAPLRSGQQPQRGLQSLTALCSRMLPLDEWNRRSSLQASRGKSRSTRARYVISDLVA